MGTRAVNKVWGVGRFLLSVLALVDEYKELDRSLRISSLQLPEGSEILIRRKAQDQQAAEPRD